MLTEALTPEEVRDLWVLYSQNKDIEIRNKLVEHYLPLVNTIAGRLAISLPNHVDTDDLKVSGYFGLMDAIDRYDYNRGNKFETYAGIRISGAMKDDLRSRDWISVSLRQKIKRYESAIITLEGSLGRTPTDDELADELGLARLTGELEFFVEYFSFFIAQEYMKVYISASVTHLGLAPFMIFGFVFLSERVR